MTCRPKPRNAALYARVQKAVKANVRRWPSAYASGLVVQKYKAAGGTYKGCSKASGGLTKWFKEKWVNVCSPTLPACGRATAGMSEREYRRAYPKCRPLSVAKKMSAAKRKSACARKRKAVSKAGRSVVWVK